MKGIKSNFLLCLLSLGIGGLFANTCGADTPPTADELLQRINTLEQQVHSLQQQQVAAQNTVDKAAHNMPVITVGASGFSFRSADTNFVINFHGVAQVDDRTFFDDGGTSGNDGFLVRRLRPILSGTVFRNYNYVFMPEFGGTSVGIQDAYVNYHYSPALQLQVGKFKSPVGLEYLQSCVNILFNERSLASALVPYRDLGVELHGDLLGGRVNYAVGVFNGVADGANTTGKDYNDDKEIAGRVFADPFKKSHVAALQGIGVGVGGSYAHETTATSLTAGYKTDGQQKWFAYSSSVVGNGDHWRVSPQGSYYFGPFGMMGEYVLSSQRVTSGAASAILKNHAWDVAASWILTGEKNGYKGITPAKPFDPMQGQWGAWELAARYAELSVDSAAFPTFASASTSASEAKAWSVGLNWWLNKDVRLMTSYSRTTFSGGASGSVTRQPENVIFTRVQLAF